VVAWPGHLAESQHECVWTGRELVLFGGTGDDYETTPNVFAYSPDSDVWRALPPIPWKRPRLEFAWACTGSSLIVWSGMEGEKSKKGGFEISM
jgi:hypothetical protein